MNNYIDGKVIIITGASAGFGMLAAKKAAAMGGKIVCASRREDKLKNVVDEIKASGGEAVYKPTDISSRIEMEELAKFAVETYGRIDVLVNNAGTMPIAFFADHAAGMEAWEKCIDTNIKGTLYGMCAVYDQMMEQGQGHIINLTSIYANAPVAGGSVYQASKVAINYMTDTLRQEARGIIKTTILRPTGCRGTDLAGTIINPEGSVGIRGQFWYDLASLREEFRAGKAEPDYYDINSIKYFQMEPESIADNIIYAINQPWGVSISDITIRAAGEEYVI